MSNGFAGYFLPNYGIALTGGAGSFNFGIALTRGTGSCTAPPRDKVEIIGDGNTKGINIIQSSFSLNFSRLSHLLIYMRVCVCAPFTRCK